jgi:NAD(P)-dependent dehydrogenase (short-subunit alcohol dehydrogenase family)
VSDLNLADMSGRAVVITGGNTGIGKATAEALASVGARVVITSRDPLRGAAAVDEIKRASDNDQVEQLGLDLASLRSVPSCAEVLRERIDSIAVLDLNAGGVLSSRRVTEDGFEMQFQVNHLGHFLLTHLLLDRLAGGRVVVVSSWGHTQARRGLDFDDLQWERRPYRGSPVYGATKLMNLYFAFELARRFEAKETGTTANALHPGFVATQFGHGGDTRMLGLGIRIARPFARSAEKGARSAVWLAASPDAEGLNGRYVIDCRPAKPSKAALDVAAAERLWTVSEQLARIVNPQSA